MSPRARILRRRDFLVIVATSGLAVACKKHDGEWRDEDGVWHSEPHQASDPVPPPCRIVEARLHLEWDGDILHVGCDGPIEYVERGRLAGDEWYLQAVELEPEMRFAARPRDCHETHQFVLRKEKIPPRGESRQVVLTP